MVFWHQKPNPESALLLLIAALFVNVSCHRKSAPLTPETPFAEDYMDLVSGHTLSITVPYFSSGGYVAKAESVKEEGGALTISGSQLLGFQVSNYVIKKAAGGRVLLRFRSAETTKDGKTSTERQKPPLPFILPRQGNHVRLIYFVRSSRADHNMAIAAARELSDLNLFASRLRTDPNACEKQGAVSCIWVPAGIAVRQE